MVNFSKQPESDSHVGFFQMDPTLETSSSHQGRNSSWLCAGGHIRQESYKEL
jgi:hypothetical protein